MLEEQEISSESDAESEHEFIDSEINVDLESDIAEYRELLELIEAGWILDSFPDGSIVNRISCCLIWSKEEADCQVIKLSGLQIESGMNYTETSNNGPSRNR